MGNYVERELIYAPTKWQLDGLQETATGCGRKLNSGYKVSYMGKMRRVYMRRFSNAGSFFVVVRGTEHFLGI